MFFVIIEIYESEKIVVDSCVEHNCKKHWTAHSIQQLYLIIESILVLIVRKCALNLTAAPIENLSTIKTLLALEFPWNLSNCIDI